MKNFMNVMVDAIGTLIMVAILAIVMCFTYVILLPIGAIVKSCMDGTLLSESFIELNKYFISKLDED